ncbi:MAG: ABC transporter ATP-binding protein [Nocardioidaceae bacterium]
MDVIEAVQIRKRYGDVEAVDGIDLVVTEGEVVAVLGPNGAGKTTTIELLLGLRLPTAGTVRVFGEPPDRPAVRGRVGAMLQDTAVPEGLTVAEAIRLVGRYYPYRLPVDDVLARAELTDKRRARVGDLSGGQLQRLSFGLAIAGDPDVLFLDEPTVALDVEGRRAFWEQVRGFAALGKTILFSTHYLAEADAVADRVLVIHRGRLIQDGPPAALKALVAARTIRVATDLPLDDLRAIAGVDQVAADVDRTAPAGLQYVTVRSSRPEEVVAQISIAGCRLHDLTVEDTDLEAAFVRLTHEGTSA